MGGLKSFPSKSSGSGLLSIMSFRVSEDEVDEVEVVDDDEIDKWWDDEDDGAVAVSL